MAEGLLKSVIFFCMSEEAPHEDLDWPTGTAPGLNCKWTHYLARSMETQIRTRTRIKKKRWWNVCELWISEKAKIQNKKCLLGKHNYSAIVPQNRWIFIRPSKSRPWANGKQRRKTHWVMNKALGEFCISTQAWANILHVSHSFLKNERANIFPWGVRSYSNLTLRPSVHAWQGPLAGHKKTFNIL